MKKVLAFGASNSSASINKQLAAHTGTQLASAEVTVVDLNDYEMPPYGIDKEKRDGIPELAHQFNELLEAQDGFILSMAEHNGGYTVAFKNVLDWVSRINKKPFGGKPMFLMSTSPGGRGGKTVFEHSQKSFPHFGAIISGAFCLPNFYQRFSPEEGITDTEYAEAFQAELKNFEATLYDETKAAV